MATVRMLTHRAGPDIEAASAGQVIEVSDTEAKELIGGGFAEAATFPAPAEPTAEGPDAEFAKVAAALTEGASAPAAKAEKREEPRVEPPQAPDAEIEAHQAAFDKVPAPVADKAAAFRRDGPQ